MTDVARVRDAVLGADHVVPHTDADGLAAGAIALRARGEGADAAVLLGRGPNGSRPAPRRCSTGAFGRLHLLARSSTTTRRKHRRAQTRRS
jgi:hypothetical protein